MSFPDDMSKEQRIELFHKLLTDKNYYIFDSSDGVSEWCVDKLSLAKIIRKIIKGQRDDFQYLKVYISYSDKPCAETFMAEAAAIDFLKKNPEYYI